MPSPQTSKRHSLAFCSALPLGLPHLTPKHLHILPLQLQSTLYLPIQTQTSLVQILPSLTLGLHHQPPNFSPSCAQCKTPWGLLRRPWFLCRDSFVDLEHPGQDSSAHPLASDFLSVQGCHIASHLTPCIFSLRFSYHPQCPEPQSMRQVLQLQQKKKWQFPWF